MTRITWRFALAAVLGAALAIPAAAGNPKGERIDPPKPAKTIPVVQSLKIRATKDPLRDLRGRVVLLTFADSYSENVVAAIPDMKAMNDRLGPRGLTILYVFLDEERSAVEAWLAKNPVPWGAVITDTATKENIVAREYPYPGHPWSYVVDATGNLVRHDHPSGLKDEMLDSVLDASTAPPLLPEALTAVQPDLDGGTWAAAKTALQAILDGGKLAKPDQGWAKGTMRWIELRRTKIPAEAEAFRAKGWHWDAWHAWDDFPRRFAGLDGCDAAKAKAEEIRKDPAAAEDLKNGDDLAKAKEFAAQKKLSPARSILERLSRLKANRFADRAKEALALLPAK